MTGEEKLQLDLRDFWRVHDGIETYVKLDAKQAIERLREHREDAFCDVPRHDGDGTLLCTRDAYNAIYDLAERHRESMPVPEDFSIEELAKAIRSSIVLAMVEEKQDEPAVARVLAEAVAIAGKNHVDRTYHFPCVIVPYEEPPQFRIGPVVFTAAKYFGQAFAGEIKDYISRNSDQEYGTKRVRNFEEYISHLGWVASVTIPPCAKESAMRRAEVAVATALNLLRLVFGVAYGRDMRLAHFTRSQPPHVEHALSEGGKLKFTWSQNGRGALVEKDWYQLMDTHREFWVRAAHLVSTVLVGRRSEIADRVIDACTWFGDAAFESAPGTQTVDFVAALERLTTTEWFSTHKFCSRVALLAHENENSFEKTYWDAHAIHTARSRVIHGGFSPSSPAFLKTLRLAHDITRNALFRALEVHCLLDDEGQLSTLADLQRFFVTQQSKRAAMLTRLHTELKQRSKFGLA